MIFLTAGFLLLFVFLIAVRSWVKPRFLREAALAAANVAFLVLVIGDPILAAPLLLFAVAGYAGVILARRRLLPLALVIVVLVGLFLFFRNYRYLGIDHLIPVGATTLGLSYILFRTIHVAVDASDMSLPAIPSPLRFFNYAFSLFTFLSGPIQKLQAFGESPFFTAVEAPAWETIGDALYRFIVGVFKLAVVSAAFLDIHSVALAALAGAVDLPHQVLAFGIAAVAFLGYLYLNFSGYMDMVISLGLVAGFDLPENFDRPFAASDVQEFWTRWHITLSAWVRLYVFNPLMRFFVARFSSRRGGEIAGFVCVFLAFFVIGVWHAQTPLGVVYGLVLGGTAVVHRLYGVFLTRRLGKQRAKLLRANAVYKAAAQGLTFAAFALAIICLWPNHDAMAAHSWAEIAAMLAASGAAIAACAGAVYALASFLRVPALRESAAGLFGAYWARTVIAVVLACCFLIFQMPAPSFVYQGF